MGKPRLEKLTRAQIAQELKGVYDGLEAATSRVEALVAKLSEKPEPPPEVDPRIAIIDAALNSRGAVILEACETTGLSLADGCALVEKESGGRNIFGHDYGPTGDAPPYYGHEVTKERVGKLINQPGYKQGNAKMNGVGLSQLTWFSYVISAEELGGAHLPINQLRVGFNLLNVYLHKYPRQQAIASYNAGEGNWRAGLDYARDFEVRAQAWRARLAGDDDKPPTDWIEVKARPAWGTGSGPYVAQYPTHYNLRDDVIKLAEKYINLPRFKGKVSCNTYLLHPPAHPAEIRSVDFWGWDGRGVPLPEDLHNALFDVIFDDPSPPRIAWIISNGRMWQNGVGWGPAPGGPVGSDAGHYNHIHVTYQ